MSMMNRQMPGLKNQHRSNKIRLNWIFMLCVVLIFFEKRISLRLSTVSVSLVEFCWSPVTLVCLLPTLLFIYIHTHPHTYNICIYLFILCAWWFAVCLLFWCVFGRLHSCFSLAGFFLLLLCVFPFLLDAKRKVQIQRDKMCEWKIEEPVNITTHARIHMYAKPERKLLPGTFFSALSSLKRIHVYILPES